MIQDISLSPTYRKVVVHTKGLEWDEATKIVEVPTPQPEDLAPGHVLVKIAYAGIESSDIVQCAGGYGALAGADPTPDGSHTGAIQIGDVGIEAVGVIAAVAPTGDFRTADGDPLNIGDAVLVGLDWGVGFREYAPLPAASLVLAPNPREAQPEFTVLPCSAMTAAAGLEMAGRLQPGETVLVTAASGGTGHVAVQWAKLKGCRVVGTCSTAEKAALLKDIGCDVVINYKTEDVAASLAKHCPDGIDVVYECIGGELRSIAWEALAPFGRLVVVGFVGDDYTKFAEVAAVHTIPTNSTLFKSLSLIGFYVMSVLKHARYAELRRQLNEYVRTGRIKLLIDPGCAEYRGIEAVSAAQKRIRSGKNAGKVYVRID